MTALSQELESVLRLWNPDALAEIDMARNSRPAGVYVTGTVGSGKSGLRDELSRHSGAAVEFIGSLADAAVVMIVVDASAPIGPVEVEQWRSALESTPVVFVINKIDVHRRWREVVTVDSDVVADCVPRAAECTFHPVSVRLARVARESGDPVLTAESGLAALADRIDALTVQAIAIGSDRKYVAAVQDSAGRARASIVERARAVTGGADTAAIRARRGQLVAERNALDDDRRALLHNRIQRARVDSLHTAADDLRALGAEVKESIDTAGRAELEHLPAHVAESANMALVRADVALTGLLRQIASDLGLPPTLRERVPAEVSIDVGRPGRRRGIEDRIMVALGASAGVGLGRIVVSPLTLVPAWAVANTVVSLLLGGVLAWWLTRSRALVAERTHLRGWVQESLARVKSAVEQRLLSRILDAESAFAEAATTAARDAAARIDVALLEVDAELRRSADHRSALLSACDRDLSALDRGLERFHGTVRRVDASNAVDTGLGRLGERR